MPGSIDSPECKHHHSIMSPDPCLQCLQCELETGIPTQKREEHCPRCGANKMFEMCGDEKCQMKLSPADVSDIAENAGLVPDQVAWTGGPLGPSRHVHLPTEAKARKDLPMARGLLDYFPDALAEVAELSRIGNEQHNPGQPLHWAKEKSVDHADCIMRHLVDRGTRDMDKVAHSTKVCWRALAMRQIEIDAERGDPEAIRQIKAYGTKAQIAALGL